METRVGSVQQVGNRAQWPPDAVYVGMPGKASRAYGIPDEEGGFGKPWKLVDDPRGWPVAYVEYLVNRLSREASFASAVKALHGKRLLCWCASKEVRREGEVKCHARILAEFVDLLNS